MKRVIILFSLFLLIISMTCNAVMEPVYWNTRAKDYSGKLAPKSKIILIVNRQEVAKVSTDQYGNWEAKNVPLEEGENVVQVKKSGIIGIKDIVDIERVIVDTVPPQLYGGISPASARAGETMVIAADSNETLKNVSVQMPDLKTSELTYNRWNGKWEGLWVVPESLGSGTYKATVKAYDMAGNYNQKDTNLFTLWQAPTLEVLTPRPKLVTYEPVIKVAGTVKDTKLVAINGKEIYADSEGRFSASVGLRPGRQPIIVHAINLKDEKLTVIRRDVLRLLTFPDIADSWTRQHVEYLTTLGIMSPLQESNLFAPDQELTRAELAVILVKLNKSALVKLQDKTSMRDVPITYWAAPYIETAVLKGLIRGYPDKTYKPKSSVSRAEAIVLIVRKMNLAPAAEIQQVVDDIGIKHWAAGYIQQAVKHNLFPVSWQNSSKLYPNKLVTRGEMAYMLSWLPSVKKDINEMLSMEAKEDAEVIGVRDIQEKSKDAPAQFLPNNYQEPEVVVRDVVKIPASQAENMGNVPVEQVRAEVFSPILQFSEKTGSFDKNLILPKITLLSPPDQLVTYTSVLSIKGTAKNCTAVYINGNKLDVKDDSFSGELDILAPGKNLVNIVGEDDYNRKVEIERKILVLNGYKDIPPRHWARKIIGALTSLGYLVPQKNGMFEFKKEVTRAEAARLFVKLNNIDIPKLNQDAAKDILKEQKDAPYIKAVLNAKYLDLDKDGKFYPLKAVTRGEMVKALCAIEMYSLPSQVNKPFFNDVPLNHPLAAYLSAAMKQGLITFSDYFYPDDPVTREFAISLLGKTGIVRRELQELYSWDIGYAERSSAYMPGKAIASKLPGAAIEAQARQATSNQKLQGELTVIYSLDPMVVANGNVINIEVDLLERVENVLISFPDNTMRQLAGEGKKWYIQWRVPVNNVQAGRYQLDTLIIRSDGTVVRGETPEFIIIEAEPEVK
ncbi:MAG: S-layer homology domain-containing protein [Candidatus Margulisiibacteriota bacterium]